jgi:hypothetical protein
MIQTMFASETRPVCGFEQVSLHSQYENEITIVQGEEEGLTIEAPPEILRRICSHVHQGRLRIELEGSLSEKISDALSTSLSWPRIKYHLAVKELHELEVYAIATVEASRLAAPDFTLRLKGIVDVNIERLTANQLVVDFNGPGRVKLAGQVVEQQVELLGPGQYLAADLASCKARVMLHGLGTARLWVEDLLEADVRGPGGVTYRGHPRVKQHLSPIGYVTRVGST